jgi:ATP-binding cassette subfamily C (CFTR/MRP) protein 1
MFCNIFGKATDTLPTGLLPTLLMPAVTFTVYAIAQRVSGGNQFGVAQAFTSLSLINILVMPVMNLTTAWTQLASGLACLDRIQDFLLQEKREEYRILLPRSGNRSFGNGQSTDQADYTSEKREDSNVPLIKVRDGDFGWGKETPIVKDLNMDIMAGQLTVIVGPVACGKSTLLKALLGEVRMLSGSVEFTVPEEIAYCDQDAWLLNLSIRENILGFREYTEDFYQAVIQACQLQEDLNLLPKHDQTIVGSQGISLSGGQKQRVVSMASPLSF